MPGFVKENPNTIVFRMLRENKSNLYLENGKLVEKPCVPNVFSHPSSNIPQQQQSQQQFVPQQRIISSAPTSFMSIPRLPDQIASK